MSVSQRDLASLPGPGFEGEALNTRFAELRDYLRWSQEDDAAVIVLRRLLLPHAESFVDDFYQELMRHAAAAAVITGGAEQIARLKGSLIRWLHELLGGVYDRAYSGRRWQVGWQHVRIGLDQAIVGGALARLRMVMGTRLTEVSADDSRRSHNLAVTLHKLLDLDQILIQSAYDAELQGARRREDEQRLRQLVAHMSIPAIHVTGNGLHLNEAAQQATGYGSGEIASLADWERVTKSDEAPGSKTRWVLTRPDGGRRTLEVLPFRSRSDEVWLLNDITDVDLARQKALQAERLALIGQMITTLAHEARNALQRIRVSTETLELELEDRAELSPVLTRLGAAQDDLKTLFDEVRNYAAPLTLSRESVRLCDLAHGAWESLAKSRRGRRCELRCECLSGDGEGTWDRFRIEQVFRNLFENSLAACSDPVEVAIVYRDVTIDGQSMLEATVRDNGPGLPDNIRERVFEPFFTTKTKGTGLGMAIADRILAAHGGKIEACSSSRGAEFRLWLPKQGHRP
jgi:signal transduction histidine kinase